MKRFVFRLERLERIRNLQRREARAVLVRALAELRQRSKQTEDAKRAFRRAMQVELPPEIASDAGPLKQLARWRDGRRHLVEHALEGETEARREADDAGREHTRKAKRHRSLERLHERRYERWRRDVELEQQKFLDEAHLLRLLGRRFQEED